MEMGQKIFNLRVQKGLTLEELGDMVGVGKSTVRKWENGIIANMKRDKILKVSEALGTTPAYLMGWDEEDPTIQNRDADLEAIEKILSADGYALCCENYDDDYFLIKNSTGKTIAGLYDYELLPRYGYLKKKGTVTAKILISTSFTLYPEEKDHIKKYRELDTHGKEMVDFILLKEWERSTAKTDPENNAPSHTAEIIPMRFLSYYQRMASAGSGEFLFPDIPTEVIAVPDTPLSRKADFVIGVNGKSMENTYFDGDKVLVEKTRDVPIGEIGIFIRGEECFIKEAGKDRLISHNADKEQYPDIIPDGRRIDTIGRVLGKIGE